MMTMTMMMMMMMMMMKEDGPAVMWNAEKTIKHVAEWRHTLQVVQYHDGRRRTGSDVIGDVRALVGEVVEVLS